MNKLGQFVVDFLKAEDGPTAVEYAVMLALIIVVCIAAITTLGGNAMSTFTSVGTTIGGGGCRPPGVEGHPPRHESFATLLDLACVTIGAAMHILVIDDSQV